MSATVNITAAQEVAELFSSHRKYQRRDTLTSGNTVRETMARKQQCVGSFYVPSVEEILFIEFPPWKPDFKNLILGRPFQQDIFILSLFSAWKQG